MLALKKNGKWVRTVFGFCCMLVCSAGMQLNAESVVSSEIRGVQLVENSATKDARALRSHALIIGIPNQGIEQSHLRLWSEKMEQVLSDKYGFKTEVLFGREATVEAIDQQLRRYVETLSENDSFLLIFSGDTEADTFLNESYWVVAPMEEDVEYSKSGDLWFSCHRVLKYISALNARHVLLINNGDFAWDKKRGLRIQKVEHENDWYLQTMNQPSRMILNRPPVGDQYSMEFLDVITSLLEVNENDFLASSEIASFYRDATGDPHYEFGRLHDFKGSLKGEFVFHRSNPEWRLIENPNLPAAVAVSDPEIVLEKETASLRPIVVKKAAPRTLSPEPSDEIYLSFDHAFNQDRFANGIVDNYGCEVTADAVVGKAVRFEDRAYLRCESQSFSELASDDFSITFWAKIEVENWSTLFSISGIDRGVTIAMNGDGYLVFTSHGPSKMAYWGIVSSKAIIRPDKWYHIAAIKKGDVLRLYVNRELQGELEADYVSFSENSREMFLGRLSNSEGNSTDFKGSIDELNISRYALNEDDINSLYRRKFERFGVSPTLATDHSDMDRVARMSFGPDAKMADWRDVVNLFEGECEEFMDAIGIKHWDGVFVRCDGERIWKDNRHFFATRHSGTPRDYYLVHEHLDDHQLDLGSWYMTSLKVLVQKY